LKNVLIAYATKSGSTAEVAEFMGKEVARTGVHVEVFPIHKVMDLASYDAVIIGGPMIMGWHREAVKFLNKNRSALKQKSVACFIMAMNLTRMTDESGLPFPVFQDPRLAKPAKDPVKLSFKENYASVRSYLKPILSDAAGVKPVSVGFFGGKLDLGQLSFFNKLFVLIVIGATPGDYRNWKAMRTWVSSVVPALTG
jgi:menaquinone-dependent protoporphyrinogen oxidase